MIGFGMYFEGSQQVLPNDWMLAVRERNQERLQSLSNWEAGVA